MARRCAIPAKRAEIPAIPHIRSFNQIRSADGVDLRGRAHFMALFSTSIALITPVGVSESPSATRWSQRRLTLMLPDFEALAMKFDIPRRNIRCEVHVV